MDDAGAVFLHDPRVERLDPALAALVAGGTVHLHEATPEPLFPDRPLQRLRTAAADAGREVKRLDAWIVKEHSPGVVHGVVDARVD